MEPLVLNCASFPAHAQGADADAEANDAKDAKPAKVEEASSETLNNPVRVVPAQEKFIHFQEGIGVRYK